MTRAGRALKRGGLTTAAWLAGAAVFLQYDWGYPAIVCAFIAGIMFWAFYVDFVECRTIDSVFAERRDAGDHHHADEGKR